MDELVRWLGEQLDDDESAALGAKGDTDGRWTRDDGPPKGVVVGDESGTLTMQQARHIARHDPARVLREVEANRRRLERHTPQMMVGPQSDPADPTTYVLGCPPCQVTILDEANWPCVELRDMVAAYVDGPGAG
ncbi:DUF6221 family protein [Streptomyces sp. NPDC054842]